MDIEQPERPVPFPTPTDFQLALEGYDQRFNYVRRFPRKETDFSVMVERFALEAFRNSGVLQGAYEAPSKLDEEEGKDIFLELPSQQIITLDATATQSPEQRWKKAAKIYLIESPVKGLEKFGNIPLIPIDMEPFWKKYRLAVEGKEPIPRTAQLDLMKEVARLLRIKNQARKKTALPAKQKKIDQFYQGLIAEVDSLVKKMS